MQWENVHIFISSTFNDMHAERDYLVKSVFPALSEWCEERKLRLIDIDLRWGVTAADSEAKNTVRACLRNIDECRPFFLCFLGQRRGWVPSPDDIGQDTYELFPNLLQKHYVGETSVTEMEILHALIDPLHNGILRGTADDSRVGKPTEHAFFFLREPGYLDRIPHQDLRAVYTNEAETEPMAADIELCRWKEREIPGTGRPVYSYSADWQDDESTPEIALPLFVPTTAPADSDVWKSSFALWEKRWLAAGVCVDDRGEITGTELDKARAYNAALTKGRLGSFRTEGGPLAETIIEQLKTAIAEKFPEHMTAYDQTPLQKEIDQQARFLHIASEGFIERTGDFDAINEYIGSSENRPFAVTAYAGMGKTSFLAYFIDTYRERAGETLHYRFIGASDDSVNAERLIRSLLEELREGGKIKTEIPAITSEMMNMLPELLSEAGQNGKTLIFLDALNQLETGMKDLYWIPGNLPENIKLIISFKLGDEDGEQYYSNQEKSGNMILRSIKPFEDLDDRKALVTAYLERYFKELDEARIQTLISSNGAENPLFLKTVLSELRVFGVHNDLSEVIRTRFGGTTVSAFNAILDRIENDPAYTKLQPKETLPHIFGWIAHSRYGMSVDELAGLLIREKLTDSKEDAEDAIYLVLRQLRVFLAKRDGRVDFFYESFKIAATGRYTSGEHKYGRSAHEWHRSLAEFFEIQPPEDRHRLMEQAWQYARAGMTEELKRLLYSFAFMETRLNAFDVSALRSDYSYSGESEIILLKTFFDISYVALSRDKNQLATQLWARLADYDDLAIKNLLSEAVREKSKKSVWLRPLNACLDKPESFLVRTLKDAGNDIFDFTILPDEQHIILANDYGLSVMDISTGRKIRDLCREDRTSFRVFAVSENAKYIAAFSHDLREKATDHYVLVIEWETGKTVRKIRHEENIREVVFTENDTKMIALSSFSKPAGQQGNAPKFFLKLDVLDIPTGKVLFNFHWEGILLMNREKILFDQDKIKSFSPLEEHIPELKNYIGDLLDNRTKDGLSRHHLRDAPAYTDGSSRHIVVKDLFTDEIISDFSLGEEDWMLAYNVDSCGGAVIKNGRLHIVCANSVTDISEIHVVDLKTGELVNKVIPLKKIWDHGKIDVSSDNKLFLHSSGSRNTDSGIDIYDLSVTQSNFLFEGYGSAAALSENGQRMLAVKDTYDTLGKTYSQIELWSTDTMRLFGKYDKTEGSVIDIYFFNQEKQCISLNTAGERENQQTAKRSYEIRICDLVTGETEKVIEIDFQDDGICVPKKFHVSEDEEFAVFCLSSALGPGTNKSVFFIIDLKERILSHTLSFDKRAGDFCFSKDGNTLFCNMMFFPEFSSGREAESCLTVLDIPNGTVKKEIPRSSNWFRIASTIRDDHVMTVEGRKFSIIDWVSGETIKSENFYAYKTQPGEVLLEKGSVLFFDDNFSTGYNLYYCSKNDDLPLVRILSDPLLRGAAAARGFDQIKMLIINEKRITVCAVENLCFRLQR